MANKNPLKARQSRRKKKLATVRDVALMVQSALETAQALLGDLDKEIQLRACHAVFQGAAAYSKIHEIGELEKRLELLEEAMKNPSDGQPVTAGTLQHHSFLHEVSA